MQVRVTVQQSYFCGDKRDDLLIKRYNSKHTNVCAMKVKLIIMTLLAALHQAGRHMEDSIVAAYTALLLGILAKNNQVN